MRAYFQDGMKGKYYLNVLSINGFFNNNGNYSYQKLEPTKENFDKLLTIKNWDEEIIIKDSGEIIATHNPLYIYGENRINILMINSDILFTTSGYEEEKPMHAELIKTELQYY